MPPPTHVPDGSPGGCKHLLVVEGPDGGGKTQLALELVERHDARYVHHGSYPQLRGTAELARLYVDSMLPALLGYQAVVLDRCWLSESIYGQVVREGQNRLPRWSTRLLERLALCCGARVYLCLPERRVAQATYEARLTRGEEYVTKVERWQQIYQLYTNLQTNLPIQVMNYAEPSPALLTPTSRLADNRHVAGAWQAEIVLVGDSYADLKDGDGLWQRPFVSFNRGGCSSWLAEQLEAWGVREGKLLWLNQDKLTTDLANHIRGKKVIALGAKASETLTAREIPHKVTVHPQAWKRFHANESYPLKELL